MSEPGDQEPQPPQQPPYGPQYGQPPQYGPQYGQPPYGQSPYGQPQYGQPPQYGQAPYRQPQYSPAPVVGNPGRTAVVVGLVLLLVSVVAGVTAGVLGVNSLYGPLKEAFTNPVLTTPVEQKMTLRAAEYTVYEETVGNAALSVDVTGPDGETLEVRERGSVNETLDRNGTRFTGVATFTAATPGEYTVTVFADGDPARLVVAPSLGGLFKDAGGALVAAFGLGFLSFVLFWAGLITLIVGLVKRSRAKKSRAAQLSAPGGLAPPSGG